MAQVPESRDVLLIAADWKERRLLYGELLEAGYKVKPVPGLAVALGFLLQKSIEPGLIVLDIHDDSDATLKSVQYLLTLSPEVPAIVIVGLADHSAWDALQTRLTKLLTRPISIGKVVEVVKQLLPARNPNQ
jgi:DNA-binding NtrC family response regulator